MLCCYAYVGIGHGPYTMYSFSIVYVFHAELQIESPQVKLLGQPVKYLLVQ